MSYIEESLMAGERVVYRTKPHAVSCFRHAAALLAGTAAGSLAALRGWPVTGACVAIAGLIGGFPGVAAFLSAEYGVTNKRIFMKSGWLEQRTLETAIGKVAVIGVEQTPCGRLFGYGSVILNGAGGIKDTLRRVRRPQEFRRHVFEQLLTDGR